MEQSRQKKYSNLLNFAFIGVVILLVAAVYGFFTLPESYVPAIKAVVSVAPTQVPIIKDSLSYRGINGNDALMLLRRYARIEQDHSGMVSVINGRKADAGKHEYWAFFVNEKMAQVGPADYKTKNSDLIEWKIEHY